MAEEKSRTKSELCWNCWRFACLLLLKYTITALKEIMLPAIQQLICESRIEQLRFPYSVTANQKQRVGITSRRNYCFILPLCKSNLHMWSFGPHPLLDNIIRFPDISTRQFLFLPRNITLWHALYSLLHFLHN